MQFILHNTAVHITKRNVHSSASFQSSSKITILLSCTMYLNTNLPPTKLRQFFFSTYHLSAIITAAAAAAAALPFISLGSNYSGLFSDSQEENSTLSINDAKQSVACRERQSINY